MSLQICNNIKTIISKSEYYNYFTVINVTTKKKSSLVYKKVERIRALIDAYSLFSSDRSRNYTD
jgi:hypothetical protein